MHVIMRGFEAINKVSDKLTVETWRVSDADDKQLVAQRKTERNRRYKDEMGLIVDVPRAGGAGNSNTGNVARRAFQDEEKFADITGVDQELIHRIHTMIIAVNLDVSIDARAFRQYGIETAKLWVSRYNWYYMPVTLHQLFFHAWESI